MVDVNVQLQPDAPAGEATRLLLRPLLARMQANEAGIKADTGVEFLHDYRVAVRRTRTALDQIRPVFPGDRARYFRRAFGALGRLTNELRDLDTFLADEPGLRAMLPPAMQDDLAPLFESLRARRPQALAEVVAYLESDAYASLVDEWHRFLVKPAGGDEAAHASTPIYTLARRSIRRQYRTVLKDGAALRKQAADRRLHALRIECKQLRYLLEFFASLFPAAEITEVVSQLKRLQENLGAFTDLTVQKRTLLSLANALNGDTATTRRALIATGYLVGELDRRQEREKATVAANFKELASPARRAQMKRLFGRSSKARS